MRRPDLCIRVLLIAVCLAARTIDAAPADSKTPRSMESHSRVVEFSIERGELADALARFSEQSELQIVYDPVQVKSHRVGAVIGRFTIGQVLDRMLAGSGLQWAYVNDATIVVRTMQSERIAGNESLTASGVDAFSDIEVVEDVFRSPAHETSAAVFGFDKPLIETPRSISIVDDDTIDVLDLSAVEDLVRVVPGVFTTTRFGIQGSVDIRNVPGDTYFRGMKRLTLQGHGRSVLAAMDTIEVIGGPASPLYGMGKIGGYTNMVPKSGRAKSGGYLSETQGFVQATFGAYHRAEISAGIGGPAEMLERFDKRGGYYVYGLLEDSGSYTDGVPIKQRILQAALSVDDFLNGGRLETGASYQYSATAGALTGRFTQDLVDSDRYVKGIPLVNLDLNGNGVIGFLEMQHASPVQGALTANNQPLLQTWSWPVDAKGNPYPLGKFPVISGIPASLYNYLIAHPEADPTGALRAQGSGGPQPQSGYVPIGMVLDPRTVGYGTLDFHRAAAFERELQANFLTLFFDLVWDGDPNRTLKNQLFFDGMDQYKTSNQPFATTQLVYVWEDKLSGSWRWEKSPKWLKLNTLASLNYRDTVSRGKSLFADFSTHRTDATASTWIASLGGMTPNTRFASSYDNADLLDDGYPWGGDYRTEFSEIGFGALFDADIFATTSIMLGGRFDASHASNVDYAGIFNAAVGTSANPGQFSTADARAQRWDRGVSWNVSISERLPWNIHPYLTYARSSIVLDANNNALSNIIIDAGHIGAASLFELGVKASLWSDRLFVSSAVYEQKRLDVNADDPVTVINAYASATRTRGVETQLKAKLADSLIVSLYGLNQHTYYEPNIGATLLVDARALGFQDVRDAAGNVIYPAEAFLYGGRSRIVLPSNLAQYAEKQGNPPIQIGLNADYRITGNLSLVLGGNYFSETCSGRLCLVTLPRSTVFNAGFLWSRGQWRFKADVFNLTNERYFRARTGDTLGDVLAQAMPDRRWQVTIKTQF